MIGRLLLVDGKPHARPTAAVRVSPEAVLLRFAVLAVLFIGYGGLLLWLTLSPHSAGPGPLENRLQLHPLRTTTEFLAVGGWPMMVNVVGNLVAFMPLGFLWPLLRGGRTRAWRVGLFAAAVSFLIETLQYASGRRIADVDDVLLNALGGLLGYGTYLVLRRLVPGVIAIPPAPMLAPGPSGGGQ